MERQTASLWTLKLVPNCTPAQPITLEKGTAKPSKETASGTSVDRIMAVRVVVGEIAKYLESQDVVAARLVSRDFASAFNVPFTKSVPVHLNDKNIRRFINLKGGLRHENFSLQLDLDNPQSTQVGTRMVNKLGPQIKKITIIMSNCSSSAVNGFCHIIAAVKDTLETLIVRLPTGRRPNGGYDHHEESTDLPFVVMSRLKFLSLAVYKKSYDFNRERNVYDTTAIGEEQFSSFVANFCPNLKELEIRGLDNLQQDLFQKIRSSGGHLMKLESLVLEECPLSALRDLAAIAFSLRLKRLRLVPSCDEGMHSGGYEHRLSPQRIPDDAFPTTINAFLKHVAVGLVALDLGLKTVFDDGDGNNLQVFLTLPVLPSLRSLSLEALSPAGIRSYFTNDSQLELRFEESVGNPNVPCLQKMFPNLMKLRLINMDSVDVASKFLSHESVHDGVKRLETNAPGEIVNQNLVSKVFPKSDLFQVDFNQ